jgi:hypothetical protein
MKGKRTEIEFDQHELIITQSEGLLVHYLKKPNEIYDSVKFINTNGILAVTGDYSNWIFCREFHPTADGGVSDGYWHEKLRISSTQVATEFDSESTKKEIEKLLAEEEDLTDEEKEYLSGCLDHADEGEFDYEYYAHRENCGRFEDHEYVPHEKKLNIQLQAVFDSFDEICRRMKSGEVK